MTQKESGRLTAFTGNQLPQKGYLLLPNERGPAPGSAASHSVRLTPGTIPSNLDKDKNQHIHDGDRSGARTATPTEEAPTEGPSFT